MARQCSPLSHQAAGGEGEGAMRGKQSLEEKKPALPLICVLSGPLEAPNHTNFGVPETPLGWGVEKLPFGQINKHLFPISEMYPSREATKTDGCKLQSHSPAPLASPECPRRHSACPGGVCCASVCLSPHPILLILLFLLTSTPPLKPQF